MKRVVIVVVALLFAVVAGVAGGGYLWLRSHAGELEQSGRASFKDGVHFAVGKDAPACVDEAVRRLPELGGILAEASNRYFLEGCLKSAPPSPGFCANVPSISDTSASMTWLSSRCAALTSPELQPKCTRLLGVVQMQCAPSSAR